MISPSLIIEFLKKNFEPNLKYVSGGREVTINSIFLPDYKMHMSVNTDTGLWQCFKSGKRGNFVQLVANIEKCTYERARANILFESIKRSDVEENFEVEPAQKVFFSQEEFKEEFQCHELYKFCDTPAWKYIGDLIFDRKLERVAFNEERPWFASFEGRFAGRVFIPFYAEDKIFYFQARSMMPSVTPKYLNHSALKASEILYPFDWSQERVVVTEGPVDAVTLQECGVNATSVMGARISKRQAHQLREFGGAIILSMDNDEAGKLAMIENFKFLTRQGVPSNRVSFLPCPSHKDWNEFYQKEDAATIKTAASSSLSELYYRLYTS
jgi:DNA primase